MDAPKYILRHQTGGSEWQRSSLDKHNVIIGRYQDSDIVLEDKEVSIYHVRLSVEKDGIFLTDLNSAAGTWINGERIPPRKRIPLPPGQCFTISKYTFVVEITGDVETLSSEEAAGTAPFQFMLCHRKGENSWQEYSIRGQDVVLGRAQDSELFLDDKEVSRHHARIQVRSDGIWLTDLGSTNGTQIDGNPLMPRKPVFLLSGQSFTIGPFLLKVETRHPGIIQAAEPGLAKTLLASTMPQDLADPFFLNLSSLDHVTIGRASENNLVLNHPIVSEYHAEIDRLGTRFRLRDLRSTNGVLVNNQRVEHEVWLKDKDTIRIGPYILYLAGQNLQTHAETGLTLEARSLNQRVTKRINLLQDINLSIKPMELIAIVGMSGSGKSTLLNALSGYRPSSEGRVFVNDIDLYKHYDDFRNDMGYVPQKDIVHTELTPTAALDYVARLRMPTDTSAEDRHEAVQDVLVELDLTERKDVPIARLSGGQLKRVSIGVELLTKPRLFFLDEPTSGLDPGTEYEMMRLMRWLADQGRTVILVTHATKNVSFCDKVIFLARGGHLAFFGPPEEALSYFDSFRSTRERRQKEMEFDDIYRILDDEKRGAPTDWGNRYRESSYYAKYCIPPAIQEKTPSKEEHGSQPRKIIKSSHRGHTSSWRQFLILSERNLKILFLDKVSLALMLALAPAIGLMDFIWGTRLFDPVKGDASKLITMWFMTALITVLVGALSSVREIVKEIEIYKRERAVNLKVFPYILSKIWVGVVLAAYQAGVLLLMRILIVQIKLPVAGDYLALYVTLFLGTLCGYLVGLFISASAPNQNAAILMIIVALIPQFLFAGALLPLNLIPGGEAISIFMPTRWVFESFIRIAGPGEQLVSDPCWQLPKSQRDLLTDTQKATCSCMGVNIFNRCADFPGILSPDYYSSTAAQLLTQPQPVEPLQPTALPYPTEYPSPTPLPTPTMLPSPTLLPTPADPRMLPEYMGQQQAQGQTYQASILGQFDQYRIQSEDQGHAYADLLTEQGNDYSTLRQAQGNEYQQSMRAYGDARSQWQESREKAINSAEALLGTFYDNYGRALKGTVAQRWLALLGIMAGLTALVLFFQRRKDAV